jgi:DNA (cytosine-5)-methyltransferase 1
MTSSAGKETSASMQGRGDFDVELRASSGGWLRSEREKRHISQARFAQLAGVAQHRISAFELGKTDLTEGAKRQIRAALSKYDSEFGPQVLISPFKKTRWSLEYGGKAKNARRAPIQLSDVLTFASKTGVENRAQQLLTGISLFSGCGGMSLGFRDAGFRILGSVEIDSAARAIYHENFPTTEELSSDITSVSDGMIRDWRVRFGEIDVLFGGPPCQGFSLTGKRDRWDPRNQLYRHFARVADTLKPRAVVLENVRLLTSMRTPEGRPVADSIVSEFSQLGYEMRYLELNAQDYGVPQFRERVFFIGFRADLGVFPTFPAATHTSDPNPALFKGSEQRLTLRDAIGDLEYLEAGEASASDPLHFAVDHPKHVIEMLRCVPEGQSAHDNIDPAKRPKSGYNTTYKRLRWDEPSSTIGTTFGMISGSRNVHPTSTRSLTIREAMRCQTFPDNYLVFGSVGSIRTAIGNSVPPLLARVIATHLRETLNREEASTTSALNR